MLSTMNERQSQVAKNVVDMSIVREPKLEKPVQSKDIATLQILLKQRTGQSEKSTANASMMSVKEDTHQFQNEQIGSS